MTTKRAGWKFAGKDVVASGHAISALSAMGHDVSPIIHKVNSFRNPVGQEHASGWLLMAREDVEDIDTSAFHELEIDYDDTKLTFKDLLVVKTHRFPTVGVRHENTSMRVVEIADKRWLAKMTCYDGKFNLRTTCNVDREFIGTTVKNDDYTAYGETYDDPWEWHEIAKDIWEGVGTTILGAWTQSGTERWPFPAGDRVLTTTPENIVYKCSNGWAALNDFVHRVGLEVRYDPFEGVYDIIQMGHGSNTSTKYRDEGGIGSTIGAFPHDKTTSDIEELLEDAEFQLGNLNYPASVKVKFPANHRSCDASQCNETPFWCIEVTPAQTGLSSRYTALSSTAFAGTCVVIKDSMSALIANEGGASNGTELLVRAIEVAADYYRTLVDCTPAWLVREGAWKITPGPFINEVTHRDYGDGLKTEIRRYRPMLETGIDKGDCAFGEEKPCVIRFSIDSMDDEGNAYVSILDKTPDCDSEALEDEYGHIIVADLDGCFFDEEDSALIGRTGWARVMIGDAVDEYNNGVGLAVFSLCCSDY